MKNVTTKPSLELLAYQQQELSTQLDSLENKLDELASNGSQNFQAYEARVEGKFATKQELVINQQSLMSQITSISDKLGAQISLVDSKVENIVKGQKPYQTIFYDLVKYLLILAIGGGITFALLHR